MQSILFFKYQRILPTFQRLLWIISSWINPLNTYQRKIDTVLADRKKTEYYYQLLSKGRSSSQLIAHFKNLVEDKTISNRVRASVNAILGFVYNRNINVNGYSHQRDKQKAKYYFAKAQHYRGDSHLPFRKIKKIVNCIRLGGENVQAFEWLNAQANTSSGTLLHSYANKILAHIYKTGIKKNNLTIYENQPRAQFYRKNAKLGYQQFQREMSLLTQKLSGFRLLKNIAFSLIKKIADMGNRFAQYKYAKYIEDKKLPKQNYMLYYHLAAAKNDKLPFSFRQNGDVAARKRVLQLAEPKEITSNPQLSDYRFSLALHCKDEYSQLCIKQILAEAEQGNMEAKIQVGLYQLNKRPPDIQAAELMFKNINTAKLNTDYQSILFQKFCAKLAHYYEDLFLKDPTSLQINLSEMGQAHLKKAVFYLQHLSLYSKNQDELQFKIAHYQKFFLKKEKEAISTFQKLALQGDSYSAFLTIFFGFKQFWLENCKQLNQNKITIITQYERVNLNFFDQFKALPLREMAKCPLVLCNKLLEKIHCYKNERAEKTLNKILNLLESDPNKFAPKQSSSLFFSSKKYSGNEAIRIVALLQVMSGFLTAIENHYHESSSKAYFEIMIKVYFNFMETRLQSILDSQNSAINTTEIHQSFKKV